MHDVIGAVIAVILGKSVLKTLTVPRLFPQNAWALRTRVRDLGNIINTRVNEAMHILLQVHLLKTLLIHTHRFQAKPIVFNLIIFMRTNWTLLTQTMLHGLPTQGQRNI